ncbi:hypothetical protein D3C76_597640 [compost metagenome]
MGTAVGKRRRGFDFERLLNKLFNLEQLEPRTDYRPVGEQMTARSISMGAFTFWKPSGMQTRYPPQPSIRSKARLKVSCSNNRNI